MRKFFILTFFILISLIIFPPLDSEKVKEQGGFLALSKGRQESVFSVQTHLHGSLSEFQGTMAWHTQQAESSGIDVLWWSDHDNMIGLFNQDFFSFYNFESGNLFEIDPGGRKKFWRMERDGIFREIFPFTQVRVTNERAYTGRFSLKMVGVSGSLHSWQALGYRYRAGAFGHIRSLLSNVSLNVAIYPVSPVTRNTMIFVRVQLSQDLNFENPRSNFLYYVLSSNPPVSSPNLIFIPLPYQENQWNFYTLPITADAITYFPSLKDDQSLHEATLGIAAKNLAGVTAFFDDFRINTNGATGDALLALQREVLKTRYSSVVTHYVGTEISNPIQPSRSQLINGEEPIHLNALGSKVPLLNYNYFDTTNYPKSAVAHVHQDGGIVSYNHLFGYSNRPIPPDVTPEKFKEEVKTRLLVNKVYGADLLEVGYVHRRLSLKDFLEVWDALSMANIFITGIGVTDDHGGPFTWATRTNRFVTWVYAPSKSEEDLITGLKSGRAFFGDPFGFVGAYGRTPRLDLTTPEGFRMGQTIVTPLNTHQVNIEIEGLTVGDQVKLIENGVITQEFKVGIKHVLLLRKSFRVTTRLPKVVRVEVYAQDDTPKAFSNPIYFLKILPPEGLPVARIPS